MSDSTQETPNYIDPEKTNALAGIQGKLKEITERFAGDPDREREARNRLYRDVYSKPTPASVVIDHIEHVIRLVGAEHVGLGADWDGVPSLPEGLEDCSKLIYVTEELLRRGHGEEDVKLALGEAFLLVMEKVERPAPQ